MRLLFRFIIENMEINIIENLKVLRNGIPDVLPSMPEKNLQVPHAPARNPKLS